MTTVPLGLLLALAGVLVAPGLRRGDPEIDHRIARVESANFRVAAEIADQDNLVDAACHDCLRFCGHPAPNGVVAPASNGRVSTRGAAVHS